MDDSNDKFIQSTINSTTYDYTYDDLDRLTSENNHTYRNDSLYNHTLQPKGVSNANADTLLDWAEEYDFPNRDDRGKPHWDARDGMDHIQLGPKHIPVNN